MKKAYRYHIKTNQRYYAPRYRTLGHIVTAYIAIALLHSTLIHADSPKTVITNSWALAETLIALETPPQAFAMTEGYKNWGHHDLPKNVRDIGFIQQPNLELIAQLSPDIFLTDGHMILDERIEQNHNILSMQQHDASIGTWEYLGLLTQDIAIAANTNLSYEQLLRKHEGNIDNLKQRLEDFNSPLLIIYLLDDRHVRVFSEGSLIQTMLETLEINNAWDRPTNDWGYSTVAVEELIEIDAQLVIIEQPGNHNNSSKL